MRPLVALGALLLVASYAMLWPGLTEPMLTLAGTVEKAKLVEVGRDILRESSTSSIVKGLAERMIAGLDVSGTVSAFDKTNSILGTARTLADGGNRFVAALILTFSVAVPVAKGLVMLGAALPLRPGVRSMLLGLASAAGKWSMADVFVIAIFIAFLGGNGLSDSRGLVDIEASLGVGFSWFLGYCLLSIAASQLIAFGVGRGGAPVPPTARRPAPSPPAATPSTSSPAPTSKPAKKRKPVTATAPSPRTPRRSAR